MIYFLRVTSRKLIDKLWKSFSNFFFSITPVFHFFHFFPFFIFCFGKKSYGIFYSYVFFGYFYYCYIAIIYIFFRKALPCFSIEVSNRKKIYILCNVVIMIEPVFLVL